MTLADQQIVPGITISAQGEATVDPALTDVLLDLALTLEEPTGHPVDVQHVLAAIVLAVRSGQLDSTRALSGDDRLLVERLIPHVKTVFSQFGGNVGRED